MPIFFMQTYKQGARGFTLIELLIVIAIIGTIGGLVKITASGFIKNGEKRSVNEIFYLLRSLRTEAELSNSYIGLYINEQKKILFSKKYDFNTENWQLDTTKEFNLPATMALAVNSKRYLTELSSDSTAPSILFFPDGTVSDFEIALTSFNNVQRKYILKNSGSRKITLKHESNHQS